MLFSMDHAHFCRGVVFRGVPPMSNVIIGIIGAVCALCENALYVLSVFHQDTLAIHHGATLRS